MEAADLVTIDDCFRELDIVKDCCGVLQGPFHEFDVYDHIERCFRIILDLTSDPHLTVAARLHDVGKPNTQKRLLREDGTVWYREDDSGRAYYTFPGHEFYGAHLVKKLDSRLFTLFDLNQIAIANLVAHHYLPMRHIKAMRQQVNFDGFKYEFRQLEAELKSAPVSMEDVLTLFYADKIAQGNTCKDQVELFAIRALLLGEPGLNLRSIYELQQAAYHSERD